MRTEQPEPSGKVLIFMVAYGAEKLIESTLSRIPEQLYDADDVHILCIDDASKDRTAELASAWVKGRGYRNVTILRNPVNQGYGGNQKLGYRLAIEWGFDFVILLHGDGQYAPELLPMFIDTWRTTDADVVIGSRMQSMRTARAGGMPIYKLFGNRTLTVIQNRLAGQRLSEWHSGYRAYSTSMLRRVPFEIDTNDFHFDTELLLQATYVDAKFVEFPIPTHYGDEVCHVNGMRYAKDVLIESAKFRLHKMGFLTTLKYQKLVHPKVANRALMRYTSHRMALDRVRKLHPKTLIDIGCGQGEAARECENLGIEVTGIDAAEPLPGMMRHFVRADFERDPIPIDVFANDVVLMLEVIERIANPEHFLLELRNTSLNPTPQSPNPKLILSTPNVAFAAMRLNLLLGRFNYAERGILEISHKRVYTKSTLVRLLRDCGYHIDSIEPVPAPFEVVMPPRFQRLGKFLAVIASILARVWPRMFAFQWLVVCQPKPGIQRLLSGAERPLTASYPLPEAPSRPISAASVA